MSTPPQGYTASAVIDNGSPVVGGTVNGVLYVNSSGNLDSGSVLSFNGTNLSMASGQILQPNGTAALPSYAFTNATNYGFYTNGSAILWSSNGANRGQIDGSISLRSDGAFRWSSTTDPTATADTVLVRDAAGILAQRNGTNAQVFRVMNTYTAGTPDWEAIELNWQATANSAIIRTMNNGTGTARQLVFRYGGSSTTAIAIPITGISQGYIALATGSSSTASLLRVKIGDSSTMSATSGTGVELNLNGSPAPTGTSTMVWSSLLMDPTINYSNGTPGAGQIKLLRFAPVTTALPTGLNAACVFSSTASALGGMHFHNQTDEATNYEIGKLAFVSNVLTLSSTAAGSGTIRNIGLSVADATAQAIVVYSGTSTITGGVTDGYTSGLRLTPTYTAATAQTVTRHNYIDINDPTLSGAGPAALTDACVFRFNAAAGTHKAVDAGTTKTTPGTVDAWVQININGTLYYIPSYTSKTS